MAAWTSLTNLGSTPSTRRRHSMTALSSDTLVCFAGYDGRDENGTLCFCYRTDVCTIGVTGTSATWASLTNLGSTPSTRRRHSMTALSNDTLVCFAGYDGRDENGTLCFCYRTDVCTIGVTGTSATWASLTNLGSTPSTRRRHSMTALSNDTLVCFAGYDGRDENGTLCFCYRTDVCTIGVTGTSATWASLTNLGSTPRGRGG